MVLQRVLLEMSIMSNNDEHVYFVDLPEGDEISIPRKTAASFIFQNPRVVLQRRVYQEEIADGLDVSFKGSEWDEEPPEITLFLDAYFRLHNYFKNWQDMREEFPDMTECSPSEDLAEYIAQNYYDCMSGGLPSFAMPILKELVSHPSIDLSTPVYPGKDQDYQPKHDKDYGDWYTLGDFLKSCEEHKHLYSLEETLQRLRNKLPAIVGLPILEGAEDEDENEDEESS